ncbi:MAG: hypothetical protein AAGA80_08830 [Cyanobacteria bacterium P01_F01_bin.143]
MRVKKIPFITFMYWVIAGVAPLGSVLLEFGWNIGFDYAKFYSPLFFYPFIFGPLLVYFEFHTILFFLALPLRQRFNLSLRILLIFFLTVSILINTVEISGRPAIWEVKKSAIEATIISSRLSSSEITTWDEFIQHFRSHPETPKSDEFDDRKSYQIEVTRLNKIRSEFNDIIVQSSKKINNWSLTRYFYFPSFFIQQFVIFSLFITISFITNPRLTLTTARQNQVKKHLILLSMSLFFGIIWLYMRLAFDIDKLNLYGGDLISTSAATFFIGFLYVLAIIYLTRMLWSIYQEKFQVTYNIIAAIMGIVLTVFSTRPGGNFLGSDASPQNYAICILAIVIILFPWYITYKDILD